MRLMGPMRLMRPMGPMSLMRLMGLMGPMRLMRLIGPIGLMRLILYCSRSVLRLPVTSSHGMRVAVIGSIS